MRIFSILILILVSRNILAQQNPLTSGDPLGFRKHNRNFLTSGDPFRLSKQGSIKKSDTINNQPPVIALNVSVLPLFGYFPTLQVGFEHRVYKKLSLGFEYGIVTPFEGSSAYQLDRRGNRLKFESKLYLNTNTFDLYYFSFQFFQNDLRYDEETVYGINCPDGTCDYFQFTKFTTVFKDFGLLARIGSILYLNQANTFFLDGSLGLGFRDRDVSFRNKPEGTRNISYQNSSLFQQSTEDYQGLHVNLSIKIAYRFK